MDGNVLIMLSVFNFITSVVELAVILFGFPDLKREKRLNYVWVSFFIKIFFSVLGMFFIGTLLPNTFWDLIFSDNIFITFVVCPFLLYFLMHIDIEKNTKWSYITSFLSGGMSFMIVRSIFK